ncbi:hypothetical protein F5Y13DRAFT_172409 [Hypoxylon sp. FL1857]|nr:hypothetical protein F5Y13DRAFT_172409 [Hypoxylon sp. FL1857]
MRKAQAGGLIFGVEIEIHVPVLKAPDHHPMKEALDFPSDDWYEKNCIFYTSEDGRKIPVVKDDVTINKEARRAVWDELIVLFKETIESPAWGRTLPDIEVVTAEIEHPKKTQGGVISTSSRGRVDPRHNTLGNFIDGHYEVYNAWTVCKDESGCWYQEADGELFLKGKLPPIGPLCYSWFSIEIKSKAYKDLDAMQRDLQKVCDRIRSRFLVSINCGQGYNRTSTHVHVGRSGNWNPDQEDLPFSLVAVKKMATAMCILEPILMEIQAPWKAGNHRYAALLHGYTHLERLCNPDTASDSGDLLIDEERYREDTAYGSSRFIPSLEQRNEMKSHLHVDVCDGPHKEGIGMIWAANDLTDLAWLLSCREQTRRAAFALHGLVPIRKDVIKSRHLNTIEFRHMHGSLDAGDIMNWVRIIEKIVDISTDSLDNGYVALLNNSQAYGRGSINKVVEDLGLTFAVKSEEQIAKETSLPEVPKDTDERDAWSQMGSIMFLSNNSKA